MTTDIQKIFSPIKIGPLTLRNRVIRSAAFEGMSPGGLVSDSLVEYHGSVAAGGVGMTTVAYAAVEKGGLTFAHQLWMRPEAVPGLRKLTDAVHREGAAASIQLGHAGYMADGKVSGKKPIAPSRVFNLYGLVMPRAMTVKDIEELGNAFVESVRLAKEAGFDAVEFQAGHGYLISQFLSPYTNRRTDGYGGSIENRGRAMREIMAKVRGVAGPGMAVTAKTNVDDGFMGGMSGAEAVEVARMLEKEGADALTISGGFVSKCPMYLMRGDVPMKELIQVQPTLNKVGLKLFGSLMVDRYDFSPAFFLEEGRRIRDAVKIPCALVGGINSARTIAAALEAGFEMVAMARALIREPDFVNLLKSGVSTVWKCQEQPCNKCMAFMYNGEMRCPEKEVSKIPFQPTN